jgi:hypothetical protein
MGAITMKVDNDNRLSGVRFKDNKNLTLYNESTYKGLNVNNDGTLILDYLESLHSTIQKSLDEYSKTFALRFDLRYPAHLQDEGIDDGQIIKTFINSLKSQIKSDRIKVAREQTRSHPTKLRYIWCKEVSTAKQCHFHFLILLCGHAYRDKGRLKSTNMNTANRIIKAWDRALNKGSLQPIETNGLVEFPENGTYTVNRDNKQELDDLFYRASYLCKSNTKTYINGKHSFGKSRL